jgi:hypothetical protein
LRLCLLLLLLLLCLRLLRLLQLLRRGLSRSSGVPVRARCMAR